MYEKIMFKRESVLFNPLKRQFMRSIPNTKNSSKHNKIYSKRLINSTFYADYLHGYMMFPIFVQMMSCRRPE